MSEFPLIPAPSITSKPARGAVAQGAISSQQTVTSHNSVAKNFIEEYEKELRRIKEENVQLRYQKELSERDYQNVMMENNGLVSKLENLENIFVGAPIQKPSTGTPSIETTKYTISKLELENEGLKKRIVKIEEEKHRSTLYDTSEEESLSFAQLKEINAQLSRRVDYLQKREKELLKSVVKYQNNSKIP
eukprot:TRINITY_DN4846_c0_g1_i18.p2 TRINITY_DN4846_c0_g1~~TRINITY_DN4846_c0_g1_i18.p2  ORF type:complete len:190 (-),score=35.62 TRINITY_DN4846_c0_g1_i18:63-632(-)